MALEYSIELRGGVLLAGAPTDPEDCFLLRSIEGLDGVGMREEVQARPEREGDELGPQHRESRVLIIEVVIVAPGREGLRAREMALRRALAAGGGTWSLRVLGRVGTPDVEAQVRVSQPLRSPDTAGDGHRVKEAAFSLRAPDPRLYGLVDRVATVMSSPESGGLSFPFVHPLDFAGGSDPGVLVPYAGDDSSWPVLRLEGPVENPVLANLSSGEAIHFALTLGTGEHLVIDPEARTVLAGGVPGASRYAAVRRDATSWWPLYPGGANAVRLSGDATSANTRLDLIWRDAYL